MTTKADTWIKIGYELLGVEGMEGIKVERLAKILALNKSGFYYYFGTMESYIKNLLQYHVQLAEKVSNEIAYCQRMDPDLLVLVVKHKAFFLVESQLHVKGKLMHLQEDFNEAGNILNKVLLSLWHKTGDVPTDATVALAYLNIVKQFFYGRINPENLTYDFLHTLVVETRGVVNKVIEEQVSHARS